MSVIIILTKYEDMYRCFEKTSSQFSEMLRSNYVDKGRSEILDLTQTPMAISIIY